MPIEKFKISPEKIELLLKKISDGATLKASYTHAGIAPSSFFEWLKQAKYLQMQLSKGEIKKPELKEDQSRLLEFLESYKKARNSGELRNLEIIRQAAEGGDTHKETRYEVKEVLRDGKVVQLKTQVVTEKVAPPDWKAAAWWLERRYKERWGRFLKLDGKIEHKVKLTDDERRRRLAKLIEREGLGRNGHAANE